MVRCHWPTWFGTSHEVIRAPRSRGRLRYFLLGRIEGVSVWWDVRSVAVLGGVNCERGGR